jgi:Fic family protein
MIYDKKQIKEFLKQSNLIEEVSAEYAHEDALKAWEYISEKEVLTVNDVLHVHKLLMNRLNPRIAGKLRDCDVWIGGQKKKFVSTEVLKDQLKNVLSGIDSTLTADYDKNEMTKNCHKMFENVHPFEDGNGRVGRIIYNWHRLKLGLLIHVIHVGQEQLEYYKWFKRQNEI